MTYDEYIKLSKILKHQTKTESKNYTSRLEEYEVKYKIELPNRYSLDYLIIEAFNDYEYTNNIAYEMIRRTNEFKILSKIPYEERTNEHLEQISKLGLSKQIRRFPNEIIITPFKKEKKLFNETWSSNTINDVTNGLNLLINHYYNEDKIFTLSNNTRPNDLNSYKKTDYLLIEEVIKNPSNYYIPCELKDFTKVTNKEIYIMQEIKKDLPLKILDEEFLSTLNPSQIKFKFTELTPTYSRPHVFFPHSDIVNIPINLNLPDNEIIAYILKAKLDYKNKLLKINHPLKLIGNLYDEVDKIKSENEFPTEEVKRKKAIADAFYIYDLYKILEPIFKQERDNLRKKRNKEIKKLEDTQKYIKNGKSEKDSKIKNLKELYMCNIKQFSKDELQRVISEITELSFHKVERFYKYMKIYIDNKKYEELITGKKSNKKTS